MRAVTVGTGPNQISGTALWTLDAMANKTRGHRLDLSKQICLLVRIREAEG